jgi:hypothetical protein
VDAGTRARRGRRDRHGGSVEALIQRGMDVVKKQVQLDVHGQKTIRIALTDAGSRDPFGRLIDDSYGVLGRRGV